MLRRLATALALGLAAAPALAVTAAPVPVTAAPAAGAGARDEAQGDRALPLRVSGTSQGSVVLVDRGSRDGVAVGDAVRFELPGGATATGKVARVQERSSMVALDGRGAVPPVGARGEVRVPLERLTGAPAPAPQAPAPETTAAPGAPGDSGPPAEEAPAVEHPPWARADDGYTPDRPLLAEVRAVRPEDRPRNAHGHLYAIGDWIQNLDGDRRDAFFRAGADFDVQNPFGRGGNLSVAGEGNWRGTEVPDRADESASRGRLDRLSWSLGGTRFDETRQEVGRFLQYGMPEFGVLDGYEWAHTGIGGDAWGWSAGFLPEPDPDHSTGDDAQAAVWYHWRPAEFETLTVDGGYQKTLHNGDADRDLFVLRMLQLPGRGWDLQATVWVDLYTSSDDKDAGLELTQAWVSTGRSWADGSRMDLTYTLLRFPDIDRNEFLQPDPVALLDLESQRVAVSGVYALGERARLRGIGGLWKDQEDAGGDFEGGAELDDLLLDGSRLAVSVFDTHGKFNDAIGVRTSVTLPTSIGRIDLLGEAAHQRVLGFSDNLDDLPRYRGRLGWGGRTASGWDLTVYAEGRSFEDDHNWAVGFFAQRYFR